MSAAVCASADPDLWFAEDNDAAGAARAKALCWTGGPDGGECPVRRACLHDALERREQHGVWGGMSPRERRKLVQLVRGPAA